MAEKALTAVIQEAYVQGVSTRSVDDLVKAGRLLRNRLDMGGSGVSKSQVSAAVRGDRRSASKPSSTARSKATGPMSGSTRPT